jgi:hypothetical protein
MPTDPQLAKVVTPDKKNHDQDLNQDQIISIDE